MPMSTASPEPLPGGEGAEEGLNRELRQLSDQALQGRLQRMEDVVGRGIAARLPDGGKAYGFSLCAVRRELARRQAATCSPPPPMETPACPSKQLPDVHVVEPKLEPCEDSPALAPDAAEDCETTPLSGDHPFFTIVMSRTQVQKSFQLCIPVRFQRHLPAARTAVILLCRGKSWAMCYCGDLKTKKLDAEWMSFAVDNRLRVGDACVFELVTGAGGEEEEQKLVFQVQILRCGMPEEVISKGATADEPMIIVD